MTRQQIGLVEGGRREKMMDYEGRKGNEKNKKENKRKYLNNSTSVNTIIKYTYIFFTFELQCTIKSSYAL